MTGPRIEAELKYRATDDRPLRRLEKLDRLGPADLGPVSIALELDRYLDTVDRRLAAARWACRLRTRDGRTIVSLKGPAEHAAADPVHRRAELEGPAVATLDPVQWPASEARDLVLSLAAGAALEEQFRLEQERTERSVTVAGSRAATLSLDRVRVLRGATELGRMWVVELEFGPAAGAEDDAPQLATALVRVAGLTPDPLSKFERAAAMLPRAS